MSESIIDHSSLYRVLMIGDTLVGKTSIVNKLIYDTFNEKELPTIGSMFALYSNDSNSSCANMQIWDTAGQEKFKSLTPIYFQNADAGVFVFDMSQPETFDHLESWIELFTEAVINDPIIIIVGNKIDLLQSKEDNMSNESPIITNENNGSIHSTEFEKNQNDSQNDSINFVDEREARRWAESKKYAYFSTSAKSGYGIQEIFQYVGEQLLKKKSIGQSFISQTQMIEKEKEDSSCC